MAKKVEEGKKVRMVREKEEIKAIYFRIFFRMTTLHSFIELKDKDPFRMTN